MSSPSEYRDHVTEWVDRARTARSDTERNSYLEMAKEWLEAAVQADIPAPPVQAAQEPTSTEATGEDPDGDEPPIQWNCVVDAASPSESR